MRKKLVGKAAPANPVDGHQARACADSGRHTCIEIFRDHNYVHHIPLASDGGLQIVTMDIKEFDDRYYELTGYPVEKAARHYAEYAMRLGASPEAMNHLAKLCTITEEEIKMATAKKAATASTKATKAASTKANSKTTVKKEPAAKKAPMPKKAPAPKKINGEKRESAAQMFKDLIMEGKLTDAQIFAKVKAKYGLDDSKAGYVKWYRNHLDKQGMNPPAAK